MSLRALLVVSMASAMMASAAEFTLDSIEAGARIDSGSNTLGPVAGWCPCDPISEIRAFYVFDLTAVSGTVTAATLQFDVPTTAEVPSVGGYDSPDANETYQINEVLSSIAVVLDPFANIAAYTDLGDGTVFGSTELSAASEGTLVVVTLNASAIAAINTMLGQQMAFGGSVTTLAKGPLDNELVVPGYPGTLRRQLVLTVTDSEVPEPATFGLAGAALAALALLRQRK